MTEENKIKGDKSEKYYGTFDAFERQLDELEKKIAEDSIPKQDLPVKCSLNYRSLMEILYSNNDEWGFYLSRVLARTRDINQNIPPLNECFKPEKVILTLYRESVEITSIGNWLSEGIAFLPELFKPSDRFPTINDLVQALDPQAKEAYYGLKMEEKGFIRADEKGEICFLPEPLPFKNRTERIWSRGDLFRGPNDASHFIVKAPSIIAEVNGVYAAAHQAYQTFGKKCTLRIVQG